MVGLIFVLRIQRAVSVGNTEESVGLGALLGHVWDAGTGGSLEPDRVCGAVEPD